MTNYVIITANNDILIVSGFFLQHLTLGNL